MKAPQVNCIVCMPVWSLRSSEITGTPLKAMCGALLKEVKDDDRPVCILATGHHDQIGACASKGRTTPTQLMQTELFFGGDQRRTGRKAPAMKNDHQLDTWQAVIHPEVDKLGV